MSNENDVLSDLDQLHSRYHVLRHLGDDGGCAVYAVRGREPGRHYVVKVMPKPGTGSLQAGTLHLWQAHTMERLDHPKLMVLHTVHHLQGGTLALAMERRRGRTLAERIEDEGAMPFAAVESTLRDVAEALAYLHGRGVVHRGVSLDSVLIDRDSGYARLAHFGIPKGGRAGERTGEDAPLAGATARQPPASAPGARGDLYRLGVVGYSMLAGRETRGDLGTGDPGAGEPLSALETLRPDAPAFLRRAIEGCIHPDPRRRWASADDFLAALDPTAEYAPVEPHADLAALRDRLGGALATIRGGVGLRGGRLPPLRVALTVSAASVVLVAWLALGRDEDRSPVASSASPAPSSSAVTVAPAAEALPPTPVDAPELVDRPAPAAEMERRPKPASAGSPPPPAPAQKAPARRRALPTLLGEELAAAD